MIKTFLTAAFLSVVCVSMLAAQTRLETRDVVGALAYFGFVEGNTIQLGGFHYIQSVSVIDRGGGEFDVRFKTTPVRSR